MIKDLVKLANHLDGKGFVKEADYLDEIVNFSKEESEDETLENSDVERPIIFEALIDRSLVIRTAVKVDDDQAADIRDDFATLLSDVDIAHMSGESFRVDYEDAVVSLPSGQVYRLHWEEMPSGRGIRSIFSNVDMVVPMIGDRADGNVDVDALSEAGIFYSLELSAVDKYKDVIDIRAGRKVIKDLVKLANHLDSKGFVKEADYLDGIINKFANENSDLPIRSSTIAGKQVRGCDAEFTAEKTSGKLDSNYCFALKHSRANFMRNLDTVGSETVRGIFKNDFSIYNGSNNAKKWHDKIFAKLIPNPNKFEVVSAMSAVGKDEMEDSLKEVLDGANIKNQRMEATITTGNAFATFFSFLPIGAENREAEYLTEYGQFLLKLLESFPDNDGKNSLQRNESLKDYPSNKRMRTAPHEMFQD